MSSCDLSLHLIFLIAVVILFISGAFTVIGFISNHAKITSQVPRDSLSQEDVVVLVGGLTFFIAFIIALLTQIRASQSLYKLIVSCISSNTEWRIDPYRRSDDSLYRKWVMPVISLFVVTTCLQNLEMSGNLTAVTEMLGNWCRVGEVSRKVFVREIINCQTLSLGQNQCLVVRCCRSWIRITLFKHFSAYWTIFNIMHWNL